MTVKLNQFKKNLTKYQWSNSTACK